MLKLLLSAGVSAAALAFAAPALSQDAASPPIPRMTFGTWGVDPTLLDPAVKPGDNFFNYVNDKWIAANPLPAEYARFGSFDVLGERSKNEIKALIDELVAHPPAAGTAERRILDAYNAYLDTDAINAAGLAPARPYLDAIQQVDNLDELTDLFAKPGYPALIAPGVTVDDKDPNSYIVSVGFDGMGLPDRDYYLVDNERNRGIQSAYKDYLTFLLGQAGYQDARGAAEAVYAFEHQVAELEWARVALRNPDVLYNKLSRDELVALAPQFPMARLLTASGFGDQATFLAPQIRPTADEVTKFGVTPEILAQMGGGLPAMMQLLNDTPIDTLKAYMTAQFLSDHASVLPSALDDARFAFFGKMLSGQEVQQPRWKRAIAATENELGEVVGKAYVERYFPPASKAAMSDLVANLRGALAASINENSWMTPATKTEAIGKLDAFNPKIGYPDTFKTYEGLTITPGAALANSVAAVAWAQRDQLSRLGKPVDKTEWGMLPQTVNAYYNPTFNEIVFPAAILQPPFFNPSADPAVNYGAIGGVIGHEMSHGFDDQGARSDATGTLRDWWQPADLAKFTDLGNQLAAQYGKICPYDDGKTCVNGRLTLGENIGDAGGLSLAYRAYHMSLNGKEAPVIDGLTGDQRFFLAWAQVWRSSQREAAGRQRLLTDPHSPEQARVNGVVRNNDAWYKAFNVKPGDALYLPPEERVHIW
ncbi:MAG: M13 family metallopeptidase [Croceibacterium sp.]